MKWFLALLLVPLSLPPTLAQENTAVAKAVITSRSGEDVPVTLPRGGGYFFSAKKSVYGTNPLSVQWEVEPELLGQRSEELVILDKDGTPNPCLYVPYGNEFDTIVVRLYVSLNDQGARTKINVKIGNGPRPGPPDPPGPTPPDPPGPTPPDPTPTPGAFRVIFVHESGELLPPGQASATAAASIREYLNTKATKEQGQPSWRLYDKDTEAGNDYSGMNELWTAVRPKISQVPCIVILSPKDGKAHIETWPATVADVLKLLKTYGGE